MKQIAKFFGQVIAGKGPMPTGLRLALADWLMVKAGEGLYFDDFGPSKIDCSKVITRLHGVCYLSTHLNPDGSTTYTFEKDIKLTFGPFKKSYESELVITFHSQTTL